MRIKQVIILLMVLVLVTQPVSAGFFGDIWNMITGKVAENVTEPVTTTTEPTTTTIPEPTTTTPATTTTTILVEPPESTTTTIPEPTTNTTVPATTTTTIPEPECTDSDGGKNYYVKGKAGSPERKAVYVNGDKTEGYIDYYDDSCQGMYDTPGNLIRYTGVLFESYCEEGELEGEQKIEGKLEWESYTCPNGCLDGACINETTTTTIPSATCTDSDDGRNYYVKGTAKGVNTEGTDFCGIRTVPEYSEPAIVDSCQKMEWESGQKCTLYEYACGTSPEFSPSHAIRWEYECPNGCQDGACIGEPSKTLPPAEPSKTLPPFAMAVWDRASTSDIILISSVAQDLQEAGYGVVGSAGGRIVVSSTNLFSEINALTDNRMILALYDKEAVIIVREDALSSHLTFSTELKRILNQRGITNIRDLSSSDLKSSNLADLFDTITPVPPREDGVETIECERSVPLEAYKNCELEGGDFVIRRDDQGCIRFVECGRRGDIDIISEEIEEIPPVAKLLSIALKLETLKIEFDQMIRKLRGIANYYEDIGNTEEAKKFRTVLGLFSNANVKIEEVKVKLKETASDMTEEVLRDIKHDIKYISEVVMQDALYIILGGEIEIEGSKGVTEEGYVDCGEDSKCLDEALRICEPAVGTSPGPIEGFFVKIKGLKGEVCILEVSYQDADMVCKIPDYATVRSDGRDIFQYCKGKGLNFLKMFKAITTIHVGVPQARIMPTAGDFESLTAECIETGGPPDYCASLEAKCREVGATTADECKASILEMFKSSGPVAYIPGERPPAGPLDCNYGNIDYSGMYSDGKTRWCCKDSDGTYHTPDTQYTKGTVYYKVIDLKSGAVEEGIKTDYCDGDRLTEWKCGRGNWEEHNALLFEEHECPSGCQDGACIRELPEGMRWISDLPDEERKRVEEAIAQRKSDDEPVITGGVS